MNFRIRFLAVVLPAVMLVSLIFPAAAMESARTISCGQAITVPETEGAVWFRFVPDSDGDYRFFSTGAQLDPYGEIYNGDSEWLTDDDDSGGSGNFSVTCRMLAGQTYYFRVSFYDLRGGGICTVQLEKLPEAQVSMTMEALCGYVGESMFLEAEFRLNGSDPGAVTWSSDQPGVASVSQEGELTLHRGGTAKITIATQSGLKDTMTVTVFEVPRDADAYGRCGDCLLWQGRGDALTVTGTGAMYDGYVFDYRYAQVLLPEGLTAIGSYAFQELWMQSVEIPSTVERIGVSAFAYSSLSRVDFLGSAPEVEAGAFRGVAATVYYPAEDPGWSGVVGNHYGGNLTWVPRRAGVTLTGEVTTATEGTTTLRLYREGTLLEETTAQGKNSSYGFTDLAPGTYLLQISKEGHCPGSYALTVEGEDVTQNVQLCLFGDVSGDGRVNVGDVARVYSHVRRTNPLTAPYVLACADINGDGRVNVGDTALIYAVAKKM